MRQGGRGRGRLGSGGANQPLVGDKIYARVFERQPELAGKITGMILSLGEDAAMAALSDGDLLESYIHEALWLLDVPAPEEGDAAAWRGPDIPRGGPSTGDDGWPEPEPAPHPGHSMLVAWDEPEPAPLPRFDSGDTPWREEEVRAPTIRPAEFLGGKRSVESQVTAQNETGIKALGPDGCVPGLAAWLREMKLTRSLPRAREWLDEMGACRLDEVLEILDEFAEGVELRPLEVKRLHRYAAEAAEKVDVPPSSGSTAVAPPTVDPMSAAVSASVPATAAPLSAVVTSTSQGYARAPQPPQHRVDATAPIKAARGGNTTYPPVATEGIGMRARGRGIARGGASAGHGANRTEQRMAETLRDKIRKALDDESAEHEAVLQTLGLRELEELLATVDEAVSHKVLDRSTEHAPASSRPRATVAAARGPGRGRNATAGTADVATCNVSGLNAGADKLRGIAEEVATVRGRGRGRNATASMTAVITNKVSGSNAGADELRGVTEEVATVRGRGRGRNATAGTAAVTTNKVYGSNAGADELAEVAEEEKTEIAAPSTNRFRARGRFGRGGCAATVAEAKHHTDFEAESVSTPVTSEEFASPIETGRVWRAASSSSASLRRGLSKQPSNATFPPLISTNASSPCVRALGGDFAISWLGLGTWAWGNDKWGYRSFDRSYNEASLREIVSGVANTGVGIIDTAATYGRGFAETVIGEELPRTGAFPVVATKYFPRPRDRDVQSAMLEAARLSQKRLGECPIGLFQIHGPVHPTATLEEQADGLAAVVHKGLARAVGVCNFSIDEVRAVHAQLARHGLPLSSLQVEFSLLRQHPERCGLLAECARLGVVVLAFCPLGMGRLTGKYDLSSQEPPWAESGGRPFGGSLSGEPRRLAALMRALREVAQTHNRTPGQVALNWVISRGAVPIPGAKTVAQATENVGALGWRLSDNECTRLARLGAEGSISDFQHG